MSAVFDISSGLTITRTNKSECGIKLMSRLIGII